MEDFLDIRFRAYLIRLRMLDRIRLPARPYSEIRGITLQGLRSALCHHKSLDCPECLSLPVRSCIYPKITHWRVRQSSLQSKGVIEIPPPFYLHWREPPIASNGGTIIYDPGEFLDFGLVLMGKHNQLISFFVSGLENIGEKRYLGRGLRGRFHVAEVYRYEPRAEGLFPGECIFLRSCGFYGDDPEFFLSDYIRTRRETLRGARALQVRFVSPLRLIRHSKPVKKLDISFLISRIRFRGKLLSSLYSREPESIIDDIPFADSAGMLEPARDATRFTPIIRQGRKGGRHPYGGLQGALTITAPPPPVLNTLLLGELLHAGRGTTQGYGQMVVEIPNP